MTAPKPLKAMSLRDSLGKTVRLLTKQGVDVQFRGVQPFVGSRGNKVTRLVLPEINDNAPPELIEAIQGFLDHEVGHIFYTPFARSEKFSKGNKVRKSLTNIVEDIRLEKLLPRDLPGTKENLERMYESVMDTFFGKVALKANEPGTSKNEAFSCVMVCGMRALAGQKAFQTFMDDNNLWIHLKPLLTRMPNISRRLREMEDFGDVEAVVEDIIVALTPPPPPPKEKDEEQDKQDEQEDDEFTGIEPDAADNTPEEDEKDSDPGDGEEGDSETKEEDQGGEGHGDGSGADDEEGDEDDSSCSGDSDEEGGNGDDDGSSDEEGDEDKGSKGSDLDDDGGDTPADNDLESDMPSTSDKDAPVNRTLRDALKMLDPTRRRALFLYNRKHKTVAEIAADLGKTEDETVDILAQARRKLRDLLNGG